MLQIVSFISALGCLLSINNMVMKVPCTKENVLITTVVAIFGGLILSLVKTL